MKKYKILMALMGLEIGGAETHVVELSKELKKQGYDIIVASNGGVYEKELAEAGIRHYHVPLNQRNVLKMARSYFILKKIIKKEKVDIVHSHARIPSFGLRTSEGKNEKQLYLCDLRALGILYGDGAEIHLQLGAEGDCGQRRYSRVSDGKL